MLSVEQRGDGAIILRSPHPLRPYAEKSDRTPGALGRTRRPIAFSSRSATDGGGWRTLTYAQTLASVRSIAASLLERDLSPERPIAILSGNDIEHALLGLAAMHVGIPYAPISVPYSLMSQDFGKLKSIIGILTPGLVFAANGTAFARAIAATVPADVEVVVTSRSAGGAAKPRHSPHSRQQQPTAAVDAAHAKVSPDTIAKFLFTSGSTGQPKGVINTQLMLCANQAMIGAGLAFIRDEPPVHGRLAAVEPHLRRQPRFRHRAR